MNDVWVGEIKQVLHRVYCYGCNEPLSFYQLGPINGITQGTCSNAKCSCGTWEITVLSGQGRLLTRKEAKDHGIQGHPI
jgi:hypothetical protein